MKSRSLAFFIAGLASLIATALPCARGQYWTADSTFAPAIEADDILAGSNLMTAYPGGKLLLSSYAIVNGVTFTGQLIRLNADGALDTTFHGPTFSQVLHTYPDGRILVSTSTEGYSPFLVKRLLADGTIDPTFTGSSVVLAAANGFGCEFLSDGRILVYGSIATMNGLANSGISLLKTDGSVDATFVSPFQKSGDYITVGQATQTADGKILVSGRFSRFGSTELLRLVRLDLNGAIDPTFNVVNASFSWGSGQFYAQSDGKFLVVDGSSKLIRFTSVGVLDPTFSSMPVGNVLSFGVQRSDGKIFYTTNTEVASVPSRQLRLMNLDGTDDSSFPAISVPIFSSSYGFGLPVLSDDGSYFEGALTAQRESSRFAISHVLLNGTIDPTYNPRLSRTAALTAHVRQPDGKHLIAGWFDYINNTAMPRPGVFNVARLNTDGTLDSTFSYIKTGEVSRLFLQPSGKVIVEGNFSDGSGGNNTVIRLNTNGSVDTTFNAITQAIDMSAIDGLGYLYINGGSGGQRFRRYSPEGIVDETFQASPEVNSFAQSITPLSDGAVLVDLYYANSDTLVRLLHDGRPDPAFLARSPQRPIGISSLPGGGILLCEQVGAQGFSWCVSVSRLEPNGAVSYSYTTRENYQNYLTSDIYLSIAGAIFDLLKSAAGGSTDQLAVGLVTDGVKTILDCTSGGELIVRDQDAQHWFGSFRRYQRTALVSPSVDTAPVLMAFMTWDFGYELDSFYFAPYPVVSGLGPFTYQWRKNGVAIPGANSIGFYIESVKASDVGDYSVEISNASGTVTTPAGKLAIAAAPVVTTQPLSHASFVGGSVSLTCAVSGAPSPTYQWQKGGMNIYGATSSTLTLNNIQLSDAGSYGLVATNSKGSVTSRFSRLVVLVSQQNAITYATTRSSTGVTAGGTVNFDYFVTNVGTKTWGAKHYLSIRDVNNTFVAFSSLIGILPGETTTANLNFPAPTTPGTYTYYVQGLEDGVEFFSTQTAVTLTVLVPVTNAITYNTTTFPVSAAPGSNVIFTYNVTNTGTATWGANHTLTLRDSAGIPLSTTPLTVLAPGASKTVNLSFTVPTSPGTSSYTVEASQAGVGNFGTQADLTLIALAPQPNAIVYNRVRYPDEVVPGAVLNLKYTLSNAGTQAWGAGHYVSLRDSAPNYLAFIPLSGTAGGATKTVEFTLTAPTTPGTYTYYVQALEDGIEFFSTQDVVIVKVVALPLGNAVSYNTSTIPVTAAPGATVNFTANVTNRGTRTWGATHYLSFRDVDNTFLAFPSLSGVAPGESRTSTLSFTAPTTPGIYTYTLQAFEDGVSFFEMADTAVLLVQ